MALVGLMQTLALEGERNNIRVNCLAPTAATAMTESLLAPEELALLQPEVVSPGLVALVREDAPTRFILLAGAGGFERANITMTEGMTVAPGELQAQQVIDGLERISARGGEQVPATGFDQLRHEIAKARHLSSSPHEANIAQAA
jgi:hypothetical protein